SARPIAGFLAGVLVLVLGGVGGLALALGSRVDDPGGGAFTGPRVVTGTLVAAPYPVIVTDPDPEHELGHAVLLSGGGKRGVQDEAARLAGARVQASGTGVQRGDIDMLLVDEMKPAPDGRPVVAMTPVPAGTWRLTGEICDGKCVAGVMRPGDGLAHKACANICISGGVPPVLVTTGPVLGSRFLLMGDPDGKALPDTFRDHVGLPRRMDGSVARIADMLVFRTDVARATVP
ncbi:MAG: hypothetical protein AB7S57_06035, partial [Acetobacteraceae bacterium]